MSFQGKTLREVISGIDQQTNSMSQELYKKGVQSSLFKIIIYPKFRFFSAWLVGGRIFNGTEGILEALFSSFTSFLVWSKLWLLGRKKDD